MTLPPLRWRLHDDALVVDEVIHRPGCKFNSEGELLPAGVVLERMKAPTCCDHCRPDVEMLLGSPL